MFGNKFFKVLEETLPVTSSRYVGGDKAVEKAEQLVERVGSLWKELAEEGRGNGDNRHEARKLMTRRLKAGQGQPRRLPPTDGTQRSARAAYSIKA